MSKTAEQIKAEQEAEQMELEEELADIGPIVLTTRRITMALKQQIIALKEELKDDPKFADLILKNILLVGKGMVRTDVSDAIEDYAKKKGVPCPDNLVSIAYKLGAFIYGGNPLVAKEVVKHGNSGEYLDKLREDIEVAVNEFYFPEEVKAVEMMGDAPSA